MMHRFRMPMGMPFEGSEDRNRRNFWCDASPKLSSFFSNSKSHLGIKWMLFKMTQWPFRCADSR